MPDIEYSVIMSDVIKSCGCSYKATEMIMEALNTFFCSQPQLLNRYM